MVQQIEQEATASVFFPEGQSNPSARLNPDYTKWHAASTSDVSEFAAYYPAGIRDEATGTTQFVAMTFDFSVCYLHPLPTSFTGFVPYEEPKKPDPGKPEGEVPKK